MPPSADSVLKTISHVINDPRLCLQRSVINQQLWDAVRNVAADLVQTAANNGEIISMEQIPSNGWKLPRYTISHVVVIPEELHE